MNICVCIKQVEETYARTGKNPEKYFLEPEDRIFRINPYDEAAMVLAVKAAKELKHVRIIILTMGPILAEDELWRIMAMGGHQLCQIELERQNNGYSSLDSWNKAQVLADTVKKLDVDLVLCGKESIDQQNGLVANFMAHHLNRPFVSAIVDLNSIKETGTVRVTKSIGKGVREIVDCSLPAVVSVDLFPGFHSMPSYKAKQRARQEKVVNMTFDSHILKPKTQRVEIAAPRPRPKPVIAPDSHLPAFERVRQLLTGSRIMKKGRMVTGSPESQVKAIIRFLEENNILTTLNKKSK